MPSYIKCSGLPDRSCHFEFGLQFFLYICSLQASFVGAMAIADLVKTTLGPKGMV
jgi:hypothetical protein